MFNISIRLPSDEYPPTDPSPPPPLKAPKGPILLKVPSLSPEPTEREIQLEKDLRGLVKEAITDKETMARKLGVVQGAYDKLVEELLKVQNPINEAFKGKDVRKAKEH